MSEEINVDEVIRTIQFSEIAQKGYKVMSNDEFDRIVNGILNLQQENQQLKETLERLELINAERSNLIVEDMKELFKYKSVLDEIRKYIKENIHTDSEYPHYMEMRKEKYYELLEILDKVRE